MALCDVCGRYFSRTSNMLRHKQSIHRNYDTEDEGVTENEDTKSEDGNTVEDIVESSEEDSDREDESNNEDEEGDEMSEEDSDKEHESNYEDGDEMDRFHLWSYLKTSAINDPHLQVKYDEVREKLADKDSSNQDTEYEALQYMRPEILKHMYKHYTYLLKLWHYAKRDIYHKKIMDTKHKLIEDQEYSASEAIERAVEMRKDLIQQATRFTDSTPLKDVLPSPLKGEPDLEQEEDMSTH